LLKNRLRESKSLVIVTSTALDPTDPTDRSDPSDHYLAAY